MRFCCDWTLSDKQIKSCICQRTSNPNLYLSVLAKSTVQKTAQTGRGHKRTALEGHCLDPKGPLSLAVDVKNHKDSTQLGKTKGRKHTYRNTITVTTTYTWGLCSPRLLRLLPKRRDNSFRPLIPSRTWRCSDSCAPCASDDAGGVFVHPMRSRLVSSFALEEFLPTVGA